MCNLMSNVRRHRAGRPADSIFLVLGSLTGMAHVVVAWPTRPALFATKPISATSPPDPSEELPFFFRFNYCFGVVEILLGVFIVRKPGWGAPETLPSTRKKGILNKIL